MEPASVVAGKVEAFFRQLIRGAASERFAFLSFPELAPDMSAVIDGRPAFISAKGAEATSVVLDTLYSFPAEGDRCHAHTNQLWSELYQHEIALAAQAAGSSSAELTADLAAARAKAQETKKTPSLILPEEQYFACPARPRDWGSPESPHWLTAPLRITVPAGPGLIFRTLPLASHAPPRTALRSNQSAISASLALAAPPQRAKPGRWMSIFTAGRPGAGPTPPGSRLIHPLVRPAPPVVRPPVVVTPPPPPRPGGGAPGLLIRDHRAPRPEPPGRPAPPAPANVVVTIDFEYVLVRAEPRPWLHRPLLDRTGWFVPGRRTGEYSKAVAPGLSAEVTGFLAVRNVVVRGDWIGDDLRQIGGEDAFLGPLALGRDDNRNDREVRQPGIQIIGILYEPLPVLPPIDDPALTA